MPDSNMTMTEGAVQDARISAEEIESLKGRIAKLERGSPVKTATRQDVINALDREVNSVLYRDEIIKAITKIAESMAADKLRDEVIHHAIRVEFDEQSESIVRRVLNTSSVVKEAVANEVRYQLDPDKEVFSGIMRQLMNEEWFMSELVRKMLGALINTSVGRSSLSRAVADAVNGALQDGAIMSVQLRT